jgi:hypothetical protein
MKTFGIAGVILLLAVAAILPAAADTILARQSNDWVACAATNGGVVPQGYPDTSGNGKWYMGYYPIYSDNPSGFAQMTEFHSGPPSWLSTNAAGPDGTVGWMAIAAGSWAPQGDTWYGYDTNAVAMRWLSGNSGPVRIEGTMYTYYNWWDQWFHDGGTLRVYADSTLLTTLAVPPWDQVSPRPSFSLTQDVSVGSTVDFVYDSNGHNPYDNPHNYCDGAYFTPTITLIPEPASILLLLTVGGVFIYRRQRC